MGLWEQPRLELAEEVTEALARAHAEATRRRHRDVTDTHVVWALLGCPSVATVLVTMGLDAGATQAAVAQDLSALPRSRLLSFRPPAETYAAELTRALARAAAGGRTEVSAALLLASISRDLEARLTSLTTAGFSLLAFRRVVAHGDVTPPPPPAEGLVSLVVLNDAFTTMEHVVETLREVFDVTAEAEKLMMTVHRTGRAVVGTADAATAKRKIDEAHARAAAAGMPLRVLGEPQPR